MEAVALDGSIPLFPGEFTNVPSMFHFSRRITACHEYHEGASRSNDAQLKPYSRRGLH